MTERIDNERTSDRWKRARALMLIWLIALPIAIGVAFHRASSTTIVIYNLTPHDLVDLEVTACGQEFFVDELPAGNNHRFRLRRRGSESALTLQCGEPEIEWEGGYIEPKGGYRSILHIQSDLSILYDEQTSVWKSIF